MFDPKLIMMLAVGTLLLVSGIISTARETRPRGDRESL
jgi:hypothetical protein